MKTIFSIFAILDVLFLNAGFILHTINAMGVTVALGTAITYALLAIAYKE